MIPDTDVPKGFRRAQAAYVRVVRAGERGMAVGRLLANLLGQLWSRFPGHLSLIAAVFLTTVVCIAATASDVVGRWTTAEVTAYCPCALCCGDSADGITADGTHTRRVPYAFAADRSLPFGARVFVPLGLGVLDVVRADDRWFRIDDRGGALDTEARRYGVLRLDLRVREHWWAVRFGRRVLPVFVSTNH